MFSGHVPHFTSAFCVLLQVFWLWKINLSFVEGPVPDVSERKKERKKKKRKKKRIFGKGPVLPDIMVSTSVLQERGQCPYMVVLWYTISI